MRARDIVEYGFAILVVGLLVIFLLGQLLGQPMLFAFVETGSMSPTLEPGDGYIAIPAFFVSDVQPGDVILFDARELEGGGLTTHRVVDVTTEGYITKGDNNAFTDQDGPEPPVADGQIVAVALQVNGEVVVLPYTGIVVMAIQAAVESGQERVTAALGIDEIATSTIGFVALVFGLLVFVFSFLVDQSTHQRTRTRHQPSLFRRGDVIIVVLILLVLIPANATMLLPAGVFEYGIIASENPTAAEHIIEVGGSADVTYYIHNSGYIPIVLALEPASDGVSVDDGWVHVPARSGVETSVTMHAPEDTGHYLRFVREYRYIGILPSSWLFALHQHHPFLAIAAINSLLIGVISVIGLTTIGTSRVRMRSIPRNNYWIDRLRRLLP